MHTQTHFRPEAREKERRVYRQMSNNSVNLEEQILPTAVGFQAMTVTETKSCESNRINFCISPKQTPKAMLTLRCYFMK